MLMKSTEGHMLHIHFLSRFEQKDEHSETEKAKGHLYAHPTTKEHSSPAPPSERHSMRLHAHLINLSLSFTLSCPIDLICFTGS